MTVERELKLGLLEAEAEQLSRLLGTPLDTIHQSNYYLDTPDKILRREEIMLRLRIERRTEDNLPGDFIRGTLTLKGKSIHLAEMSIRTEEEIEINQDKALVLLNEGLALSDSPLEEIRQTGDKLRVNRVYNQGELINLRKVYRISSAYTLDLDRTEFPDESVDYEIEVELPDGVVEMPESLRRAVSDLFNRAGVPWRAGNTGKFKRWLERQGD